MRPKNRTIQNSSVDGFVRRRPVHLDSGRQKSDRKKNNQEGFIKHSPASQKISFESEEWSEGQNTLNFELGDVVGDKTNQKKPHFWQFKKKREQKDKQVKGKKKKRIIFILILILLTIGGYFGWKFMQTSSKVFDGNVLGILRSTKLKGEDEGRVNILLAGTSEDDGPDHGGATLTDSIMLLSVDTKNNTAFTTSIPRDLWVKYGVQCSAGFQGKINNAYDCGESIEFDEPGYPKGGMGLLSQIISTNFEIPIHYYGKIDYTAFKDAVDAVGGIEITVDSPDPRGIYDPNIQPKDGGPVRLKNGVNKLDGLHALALARSRNAKGGYGMSRGDFDRTTYQRAMLIALKDKALSVGVLSNPSKINGLLDAAGDNVSTNFNTSELRRLHEISKKVETSKIQSIDLANPDEPLVTTGMYSGQSIVMPASGINNFADIKLFIKKLTSTDPLVTESATAVVLNGSGETGLAQKYAEKLAEKGVEVLLVSNAGAERPTNIVVDNSAPKKPKTKAYLLKDLSTSASNKTGVPEATQYNSDFIIILGKSSASTTQSQ
jgi:LCP family protein required for cell wall assembly